MSPMMKTYGRRVRLAHKGHNLILLIGIFFLVLMASVLSIDMAFYFTAQNQMRTAADASALAATLKLFNSNAPSFAEREDEVREEAEVFVNENMPDNGLEVDDVELGFIDPTNFEYDAATFGMPDAGSDYDDTGGYNAVRVIMRRTEGHTNGPLPSIMANILGIDSMDAIAVSTSLMSKNISSVTNGGLRPVYTCQAQVEAAFADGDPSNDTARIYGKDFYLNGDVVADCPSMPSGNWGMADFTDCGSGTVGSSTIGDWFESGFPGTVSTGECYSTKPGNIINSNHVKTALDTLIADGTTIMLPVTDAIQGSGSNTNAPLSSFVGFVITGYKANSDLTGQHKDEDLYIEGHFTKIVCRKGCKGGGDNTSAGVAVVDLRMAPINTFESGLDN